MSRYALVQFSAVKGSSGKVNVGQFSCGRLFIHVVTYVTREGSARRIAEAFLGWLGDDMDAATRRRFA